MEWKIIIFDNIKYKLVFTNHFKQRMTERWINIKDVIDSIEDYDKKYKNFWKEIVEKSIFVGNIRTVFSLKENNIILITSMILWK